MQVFGTLQFIGKRPVGQCPAQLNPGANSFMFRVWRGDFYPFWDRRVKDKSAMKICMFTNTYLPHVGGVARSVSTVVEDLRKMGHRVLVVAPKFSGDERLEDQDVLRVPAIQNFNGSDFSVRLAVPFVLANRIDDFEPDVVHSHHPFLLGDAAWRTAHRLVKPLIFTHHTLYEKYTHYVPLDSDKLKEFVIRLSTEYANLCTVVIAPSESIRRLIRRRGVRSPTRVIPTGVDTDFFKKGRGKVFRQTEGLSGKSPIIGHVGRLAPEKNLDYLANAMALLARKHGKMYFLVVGEGESKADIRRIFADHEVADRLILAGSKTGQDLADAYQAMDLFVFSSKTETQGLVLAEAMAAGKPVVALDAPGSREVVEDRKNGRLLRGRASPESFADATAVFFEDQPTADKWRKYAEKTAAKFSREACVRKLSRLYESSLDKPVGDQTDVVVEGTWDNLLESVKAEWELASKKLKAAVETLE
jgi:glycosyltransferase involved in cell wall biosynthesis